MAVRWATGVLSRPFALWKPLSVHLRRPGGQRFLGDMAICKVSDLNARRRTLLWQAKKLGWPELACLVGNFAERRLPEFSDAQAELFGQILARRNDELFAWVSGQALPPADLLGNEVFVSMLRYVNTDHPALCQSPVP
eukprot:TRINITY_DN50518_c0_g1_i1.p1 TRINITY_DN50518_c0_g1~~TRINITY_DN50518_c0_g1_i1.p1  ORF type:complete len:138 (-),score=14.68 TRINITY_DN50518_c0_g1_i1:52-465(-)